MGEQATARTCLLSVVVEAMRSQFASPQAMARRPAALDIRDGWFGAGSQGRAASEFSFQVFFQSCCIVSSASLSRQQALHLPARSLCRPFLPKNNVRHITC